MKNSCYKILKKANEQPLTFEKYKALISKSDMPENYLTYKKDYLSYSYNENGSPTEPISITENGIEYILNHKEERKKNIIKFFSQFISGFVSGVAVTVIATVILYFIGISPHT